MKLIEAVFAIFLFSIFTATASFSIRNAFSAYERNTLLNKKNSESKFIAESFNKTCEGKGYKDLNEWQKCCREMFDLDYIAWCNAEDFMEVSYENSPNALFYGMWKKSGVTREVYSRWKRSSL